jgi:hypothetical protein
MPTDGTNALVVVEKNINGSMMRNKGAACIGQRERGNLTVVAFPSHFIINYYNHRCMSIITSSLS